MKPFQTIMLRQHLHFIVIVPLLIIALTWPTALHMLDTETIWLPSNSSDYWFQIWNTWYGKRVAAGLEQPYSTDLLFHPEGLSLAYHVLTVPYIAVSAASQLLLPPIQAHLLTWMLTLFANALSAYAVLQAHFRDKWVALIGAVVFGINPFTLGHPQHPELSTLFTVPLAIYALAQGLWHQRSWSMAWAGLWLGVTAYIGLYTFVCLLLTFAIMGLFWLRRVWRDPRFWRGVLALLLIASVISIWRLYPMLSESAQAGGALDKEADALISTDLLAFVVNRNHPLTQTLAAAPSLKTRLSSLDYDAFLGLAPLLLVGLALLRGGARRRMLPWLLILLAFFVLRLGSQLQFAGEQFPEVLLPKFYLASAFPWIFRPFWNPSNFQIGMLAPLALLACYALAALTRTRLPRYRVTLPAIILLVIAFEYFGPLPSAYSFPDGQLNWTKWLGAEDDQDDIRLINLPMGRGPSKYYQFIQALTGYPQVEGAVNRVPAAAYAFINDNLLLHTWNQNLPVSCLPLNRLAYLAALDQLETVGFTHVVLHRLLFRSGATDTSFDKTESAYQDNFATIYRLPDLRATCAGMAFPGAGAIADLLSRAESAVLFTQTKASIIALSAPAADAASGFGASVVRWHGVESVTLNDAVISASVRAQRNALMKSLSADQIILFAYDPRATDPDHASRYRDLILRGHKSCGIIAESDEAIIETFLPPGFPCDIGVRAQSQIVEYQNGVILGDIMLDRGESSLDVYHYWQALPAVAHASSLQLVDAAGNKVLGRDTVLRGPLIHTRLDLSLLEPGDYRAKLIVYNMDTDASVPGTVIRGGSRFERELDIARIKIE